MTPREMGEILARIDLLPRITPSIFANITNILIDFVESSPSAQAKDIIGELPNAEQR